MSKDECSGREERQWIELEDKLKKCQNDKYVRPTFEEEYIRERKQEGGSHYQIPIQPIDYIVKNDIPYREANVIKYVTRHKKKNGAEDIRKAMHYLEMLLEDYNEG